MAHPLRELPERAESPLWLLLLVLTIGLMAVLAWTLRGERYGIVDLQLAGAVDKARRIIEGWEASGARGGALFNVYLDFLFLAVYSTTIALCCVLASEMFQAHAQWVFVIGVALAWVQWLAALFDVVENAALLKMLHGSVVRDPWPRIARWSAFGKFGIVIAGLPYVLLSGPVSGLIL